MRRACSRRSISRRVSAIALRASISSAVEIADLNQQVVQAVGRSDAIRRIEMLQLPLDAIERFGIEQLAQLRVAEQLAQLRLIDRQRLGAPLGQRRIAVVDVVGDVAEEQRRGKRRRRLRIDRRQSQRARLTGGAARPRAPACRSDRAALRDRSRAAPETIRSATRPPGDRRRVCAAATAASACPAVVSAGAVRARRFRESARRTATSRQAAGAPGLRPRRDPAAAATDRARAPLQEIGRRSLRRPT